MPNKQQDSWICRRYSPFNNQTNNFSVFGSFTGSRLPKMGKTFEYVRRQIGDRQMFIRVIFMDI
jgi:hypothetical protein